MFHADLKDCPDAIVMSIDLEKAFDSLSWDFLLETMDKMQMGKSWSNWARLLYEEPSARVRTGAMISAPYNIYRGTRQGCPLSPLLFALAMEPLAARIRQEDRRLGLKIGGSKHIVSLYTDGVLIYLRDGAEGIPKILQLLEEFEGLSSLQLNKKKTYIFPLCPTLQRPLTLPTEVNWAPEVFKYLGIRIYHIPADLLQGNLGTALQGLWQNVAFWRTLKLPVMARVALSKMVMLPRLLYYFVNLPVIIPHSWFKKLDSILRELIWDGG